MSESEVRFRALVEHGLDVITLLDEGGRILFDSRSVVRVMGYTPEERLGRWIYEYVHPEELEPLKQQYGYVLAHPDEIVKVEYRYLHKEGTWRWGEAIAVNRLNDPVVLAVVVNHRDITDRKAVEIALRRSEEQLRQAQKMEAVGRLAGGIAHDFNNVLTAIFGYVDLLLDQLDESDPKRTDVLEIRGSAERAAALTRQLLAFSRRQVMQPRTIDLNTVVTRLESLIARLVGEDIQLSVELSDHEPLVVADPGHIEQVLMNLAANARDAMPEGGRLQIATRREEVLAVEAVERPGLRPGSYELLVVRDTGTGMPETVRERIFEPFFTTKDQGKGTGLGLATVYGIVKQSGGWVYAESEEGQGTTFVVYLPRASRTEEAVAPTSSA
jgi:two-component system, cell cycle sensor histidine kinase and response regulator CckA